ncbi:MAG: hypothetical protein WBB85_00835 [Albidovulum sp.]|uniref:capsular polysaccharide export protein, LipB/KpsS family n=1 Tax=Albidovulum sp. TaxID=1872424 RepID=UPI003CBEA3F7
MQSARLILHLPKAVLAGDEGLKWFYRRLCDEFTERGGVVRKVPHERELLLADMLEDDDFHIVDHGALRHPRILNTGIAYLFPFWNLDPHGIRALSSIGEAKFRRSEVDAKAANAFHRHMVGRWVKQRRSRGAQPDAEVDSPEGAIAVFLQSEKDRAVEETCHLDRTSMVKALLRRDDPRPIVIKPHPRDTSPDTGEWLAELAARDERVVVSHGNIHDILSKAAVTVTINSAVGIESMLHRVPVVLCGRADFHHAAVTVERQFDMDGAIAHATGRRWPYAKFLYWYFRENCIDAGSPALVDDVLTRIAATGYDIARFGLATEMHC